MTKADWKTQMVEKLNEALHRKFTLSKPTEKLLDAIWAEDEKDLEECYWVCKQKHQEWEQGEMAKYLRPSTLFALKNYLNYLDEIREPSSWASRQRITARIKAQEQEAENVSGYDRLLVNLAIDLKDGLITPTEYQQKKDEYQSQHRNDI